MTDNSARLEALGRERLNAGTVRSLSIQDNVSTLSHELSLAQAALTKIRTIHRPDPTGSWCAHCQWEWPCRTYIYAGGGS